MLLIRTGQVRDSDSVKVSDLVHSVNGLRGTLLGHASLDGISGNVPFALQHGINLAHKATYFGLCFPWYLHIDTLSVVTDYMLRRIVSNGTKLPFCLNGASERKISHQLYTSIGSV